ncbi:hypothetical protein CCHR01_03870 [Colletotrichum chrysophilum]|uniref:Uncharacterized protein n=1 Tax=Colletotrichum chrysophilum TaxID=1836956 RepID=A0AAD9EM73_9PEZI|nr:hypothetical protein CCHR01_03870 [Colletotrichum chrysophilum]
MTPYEALLHLRKESLVIKIAHQLICTRLLICKLKVLAS